MNDVHQEKTKRKKCGSTKIDSDLLSFSLISGGGVTGDINSLARIEWVEGVKKKKKILGEDGWRCGKGKKKHRSRGESGLGWKREEGARGVLGTKWN